MSGTGKELAGLNTGVIVRRDGAAKARNGGKRTIEVTGVARSGTSLVASVLRAAGLHMATSCTRSSTRTRKCWISCGPATPPCCGA